MSSKINKNGKGYPVGVIPSNYIRKVDELYANKIKKSTFSGSTDANSNVVVTNDVNKIVLGIVPSIACIPTPFLWNNGNWYAHITNEAGTGVGGGFSVSGDFYYIDKL